MTATVPAASWTRTTHAEAVMGTVVSFDLRGPGRPEVAFRWTAGMDRFLER